MGTSLSKTEKLRSYLEEDILSSIYPLPTTEVIKTTSKKPTQLSLQNAQHFILHAQPNEGNIQNIVNCQDGRTPVSDASKWPYSVHGIVAVKFKGVNGISWGTGTLIGPHIVLTAGHNLYIRKSKTYADLERIQFLPGMQGTIPQFGIIKAEQYFVSPNYVKEGKEDFGILVLKEAIGERTGYFGLACLKPEEIKGKRINVTGYPGDKVKSGIYEMWGMESSGASVDSAQEFINYQIDTATGQSGSGVWYQEGEEYYVCGIHVKGGSFFNQGTFLTKAIYEQIYTCMQKSAFKNYLLKLEKTKRLDFTNHKINSDCLLLLMKYKLDDLAVLDLSNQRIAKKEAATLAKNTSWKKLSHLNLSKNRLTAKGIEEIAENTSWISLSHLDLSENSINNEGVAALAKNQSWGSLIQLNLAGNSLHGEGVAKLAQNSSWKNLSYLDLSFNPIESEGALKLMQNTSWSKLSTLHLFYLAVAVNENQVEILLQNPCWKGLTRSGINISICPSRIPRDDGTEETLGT